MCDIVDKVRASASWTFLKFFSILDLYNACMRGQLAVGICDEIPITFFFGFSHSAEFSFHTGAKSVALVLGCFLISFHGVFSVHGFQGSWHGLAEILLATPVLKTPLTEHKHSVGSDTGIPSTRRNRKSRTLLGKCRHGAFLPPSITFGRQLYRGLALGAVGCYGVQRIFDTFHLYKKFRGRAGRRRFSVWVVRYFLALFPLVWALGLS